MSVENAEYFPGDSKVIYGGVEIILEDQPEPVYVDCPWNYNNAADGEEYTVEWRFCVVKGEEPEPDALPWYDDENIYDIAKQ